MTTGEIGNLRPGTRRRRGMAHRPLRLIAATALLLGTALGACGDDKDDLDTGDAPTGGVAGPAEVPDRPVDITGEITSVNPFEPVTEDCVPADQLDPDGVVSSDDPPMCTPADLDLLGTIVIEEQPGVQEGRKVSLSIIADTLLTGEGLSSFDDLAEGQTVEAWTGDICAESYPEQCGGVAVRRTG